MSKRVETKAGNELAIQLARVSVEEQAREEQITAALEHIAEANLYPRVGAWTGRDDVVDAVIHKTPMLRAEAEEIVNAAVAQLLSPPSTILRHVERRKMLYRLEAYRQLAQQSLQTGETEDKYEIELVVDPATKAPILDANRNRQYSKVPVETRVKKGLNLGVFSLMLQLEDRIAKLMHLDNDEAAKSDATADIFQRFERDTDGNVSSTDGMIVRQKLSIEDLAARSPQVAAMLVKANAERAKHVQSTVKPGSNDDATGAVGDLFIDPAGVDADDGVGSPDRRDPEP